MYTKFLLVAFTVAAFSSCSTAYKSGQTPDDVYYSPVKVIEHNNDQEQNKEEVKNTQTLQDRQIRMASRDRRWRDLDNDYDYSYRNSPYGYCTCTCNSYGYYYNPYYSPWPVYYPKATYSNPVNATPRMVNLNSYRGYNNASAVNPKTNNGTNWTVPSRQYNNSNRGSGVGNVIRAIISPNSSPSNSSSNSDNNTRTYSPSTNSNNNNGGSSSGSSTPSGTVTRPNRGG